MSKVIDIPWNGDNKVGDVVETSEGKGQIIKTLPGPQKFLVEVPPPPKKASPQTIPRGTLLVNPDTGRVFGAIQLDGTILERDDVHNDGGKPKKKEGEEEGEGQEGLEKETVGEDEEDGEGDEGGGVEGEPTTELILQPIYDKGEPTGEYLCSKCDHVWKPVKLPKQCPKCKTKEVEG